MEPNDAYELVPQREIYELKRQLDELRTQKNVVDMGGKEKVEITNKELFDTMNKLIEGINAMIAIFQKAGEELSKTDEGESIKKKFEPISEKLEELEEQNRKMARALLAVSDSVKTQFGQLSTDLDKKFRALSERPPVPPVNMSSFDQFGGPGAPLPPPLPPKGF